MFVALGGVCIRIWRRQRGTAAAWLAVTFGDLATVSLIGLALPQRLSRSLGPTTAEHWVIKVVLVAVCVFPYLLFRFVSGLEAAPSWRRQLAAGLTLALGAWCLVLPRIPSSDDHRRPWWLVLLLVLLVADWASLASMVCVQLWKAGSHQPKGVKRRTQLLAIGSIFLILALVPLLSSSNSDTTSASHLASELIGLAMALLFYLGFAPPAVLRASWRRPAESALVRTELTLMTVVEADQIARSILPPIAATFAARRAALVSISGTELGAYGITPQELARWVADLSSLSRVAGPTPVLPGVIGLPLRHGWLLIETGAYTPLLGEEELALLYTLGAFIDLALERAELFAKERDTRHALERTHAELESLVYSFSHDLKSPLISLLGYMDYLRSDYGDRLDATATHYLDRMGASAVYMTELIQDLLELSRIGRTDTSTEEVALEPLIRDIATGMQTAYPDVRVDIGDLPAIRANGLRARQLFTNLLENAAKHGGRPDLTITVRCRRAPAGTGYIEVSDNGNGIPAEYRERVFGIFERLEHSDAAAGTGMGLAICRKIVEQLNGHISIVDGDGGATFQIELPANALLTPLPRIPQEVP